MSRSKPAKPAAEPKARKGKSRIVKVDALARVEGEGGLLVKVKGGRVEDVQLQIYEPPRFFEAFLRGRKYTEPPDITARICGICPVAYQMSSVHAIEDACGVKVEGPIRELRRLLYCGEWIESHVLHTAMLHVPDFLGYPSALHMAKDHPDVVNLALRLKKHGNEIVTKVGGREIHPVNVRVGGFYRAPSKKELEELVPGLTWGRGAARQFLDLVAGLPFPDFERDYEFVALRHPSEYPLCEGRVVSTRGLDVAVADYESHFVEEHVKHSNALHSRKKEGGTYHVGPIARYNLNFDRFPAPIQEAARKAGLPAYVKNPFKSVVVRVVETLWAIDEALRIIAAYEPPSPSFVRVDPRAASGSGCTEAPRGILYHRYRLGADGLVKEAKIVPPTAQNLRTMEEDLADFVPPRLHLTDDQLTWQCEQAVRNYDPCISCATHFLKLTLVRE